MDDIYVENKGEYNYSNPNLMMGMMSRFSILSMPIYISFKKFELKLHPM
jgi:hypothetical protein